MTVRHDRNGARLVVGRYRPVGRLDPDDRVRYTLMVEFESSADALEAMRGAYIRLEAGEIIGGVIDAADVDIWARSPPRGTYSTTMDVVSWKRGEPSEWCDWRDDEELD